jgi:hypothetical protein
MANIDPKKVKFKFGKRYKFKYKGKGSHDPRPDVIVIKKVGHVLLGINLNYTVSSKFVKEFDFKDQIIELFENERLKLGIDENEIVEIMESKEKRKNEKIAHTIFYANEDNMDMVERINKEKNDKDLLKMLAYSFRTYIIDRKYMTVEDK